LPTEAQWQRAAQGDDNRLYAWGSDWDSEKCNDRARRESYTESVTLHTNGASPFGVLGMSGNVWEMCISSFLTGLDDLRRNDIRVRKGGAGYMAYQWATVTMRHFFAASSQDQMTGFRVVLNGNEHGVP
jgi:formylglycine-generating enzyme required for sulfatase activity